jgi:hypothetical protein
MGTRGGPYLSRFAVISAQTEAWAIDSRSRLYLYDGLRFWRSRRRGGSSVLIPAWQAPAFGWVHADGCECQVCRYGAYQAGRVA